MARLWKRIRIIKTSPRCLYNSSLRARLLIVACTACPGDPQTAVMLTATPDSAGANQSLPISTSVASYQGAGEGSSGAFCLKEYRQSLEAASQGRPSKLLPLRDAATKAVFTQAR